MALKFWGEQLVLLGVLGRSSREMEFVPHSKGGVWNMCSERGQGTVLDSTEPIR